MESILDRAFLCFCGQYVLTIVFLNLKTQLRFILSEFKGIQKLIFPLKSYTILYRSNY